MARTRGRVEKNEASTTSTTPSSVPFPNSNAGSITNTPATSGAEDEEFYLHKKLNERSKRNLTTRQKRSAESDDGEQSFSTKPSAKRRTITKGIYVEIPVRPANVSVSFALPPTGLRFHRYLLIPKNKGKGKEPFIPLGEEEDEIVPDSESCLGYDALANSDEEDSEFDASELSPGNDDSDGSDQGISLRNGKKSPYKNASRVKVVDYDNPEEEEEIMLNAAISESIRYSPNRGASTSANHASRTVSTRATRAATAAERRLTLEQSAQIDSDIVLDSDPEGEVLILTDSEDVPIAKKPKSRSRNRKGKKKGKEHTQNDRDSPNLDYFSARREARMRSRMEKQEIRMHEIKLNRRLTHVSLASVPVHFYANSTGVGGEIYNSATKASP